MPLFVEELTKMLLASELLQEDATHYELTGPLLTVPIPDTLQDSLMARLDRYPMAKEVAQFGSVLGREFSYDMLEAIAPQEEASLQGSLAQLVKAELLYQRGRPPQARYLFKHALIQDAAYASLLKRTRQQAHQQVGEILAGRFPETVETQPELLAHHHTEAGLNELALDYWQRAGQRAVERSAQAEAIGHFTKGLELLATLPDTPARPQRELTLQITLGRTLMAVKGYGAPAVEHAFARARQLCQQVQDRSQLSRVLAGMGTFYLTRGDLPTAREVAEQLLALSHQDDLSRLLVAHNLLGEILWHLGEFSEARTHLEQGMVHVVSQDYRPRATRAVADPRVACLSYTAFTLDMLGYRDQAQEHIHNATTLAEELSHPHGLAFAFLWAALHHCWRRDAPAAQRMAEATVVLASEQGFQQPLSQGTILQGYAGAIQGHHQEGITTMQRGLDLWQATGAELAQPMHYGMLAEVYGRIGQPEEGLRVLAQTLDIVSKTGERHYEAELYRLKGELLLTQPTDHQAEAETCFQQALDLTRQQHAKTLELCAATSLARLWQFQDKRQEAVDLLTPVYGWFTEGFDTADLLEARALLNELV